MRIVLPKLGEKNFPTVEFARQKALGEIERLNRYKVWEVTIEEKKPRRSENQNRYLWGAVYPEIMKHLEGFDADDVHEFCLGECFGWEVVSAFGMKRQRPIKRSSRLNKQEFADYVAFIQRYFAQKGIVIPDPE